MAMERNLQNMSPIDLEMRFAKMTEAMILQTSSSLPKILPKIQMVANDLRERTDFNSYYLPKVVSMGPIHHGKPGLQIGEQRKLIWAQIYIRDREMSPQFLYKKVEDEFGDLKSHFAKDVLTKASVTLGDFRSVDEKLKWMLFVDGCALLCILMFGSGETEGPIMKLVIRDVLLLENQLPMSLLYLLSKNHELFNLRDLLHTFYWKTQICINIGIMDVDAQSFIYSKYPVVLEIDGDENEVEETVHQKSAHLLHEFHTWLLPYSLLHKVDGKSMTAERIHNSLEISIMNDDVRYMNLQELKSNGIRVKPNATRKLTDIHFFRNILGGELVLPRISLDDVAMTTFINLTAFEKCPDFNNDYGVGSFLAFITSFLRQEEDVKDLRSALILRRTNGSDEELLKQFHFIATDVVSNADTYIGVSVDIYKEIKSKWRRFLRNIRHPWTKFAIHTTELAFALAVIQTWFTIHPAKS